MQWSIEENPSEDDIAKIYDGVIQYGRSQAGVGEPDSMGCFLRQEGEVIAGVTGRIEFNRLFVEYLWTAEEHRRNGYATHALEKIEAEASARNVVDSLIETLDDMTAEMYLRRGYKHIGKIQNYIPGFTKHILLKRLTSNSDPTLTRHSTSLN